MPPYGWLLSMPERQAEQVSGMVPRYSVPAFAGTTHYFLLSWQLFVVERKYLMSNA